MIVENQKELDIFMHYWMDEPSIIIPIWYDLDRHPMNNKLSFLYVRFRDEPTDQGDMNVEFILPFNHNDCESIEMNLSKSVQPKQVYNKKGLLQTNLNIQNTFDIQANYFFNFNQTFNIHHHTEVLTNFYSRQGIRDNLGNIIPIMRWMELLRSFTDNLSYDTPVPTWINETMIPTLSQLEQFGVRVVSKNFLDKWPSAQKHLSSPTNDVVYTEYNPYTMTSRPSNRHGGVNYSALNKKDGTRELFIPRDGKLFLQFDYDAYHVRIIGKLIGYTLPETSVHQWLADQYGCTYEESKGRTFTILYGGVSIEDMRIPFFKHVDEYITKLYTQTKQDGFFTTPKGRKIYLNWIEDVSATKVFNYLLQAIETELNIEVIQKLFKANIKNIVLYTYDSFLFEYPKMGGTTNGTKIKDILESKGFPVKVTWGDNYNEL